eukprot:1482555-Prymnesium_polylepis.1
MPLFAVDQAAPHVTHMTRAATPSIMCTSSETVAKDSMFGRPMWILRSPQCRPDARVGRDASRCDSELRRE